MSRSIDPQKLLEIILKAAGLYSPPIYSLPPVSPVTLNTQPHTSPSFPIASPVHLDKAKAIMDDKPKPVPFSGMAGYSERGEPDDWDMAMGEVYGYRWWYLVVTPEMVGFIGVAPRGVAGKHVGTLYGANNQLWKDGRMEARCTASTGIMFRNSSKSYAQHYPPETREACGCGFWAYFNQGLRVQDVLATSFAKDVPQLFSYGAAIPVFGVVKGTGRVIIGERGFRSQYAEIVGLCIPPGAVTQLGWWLSYGGRPDYAVDPGWTSVAAPDKEKCSEAQQVIRIAEMEALLADTYPSARLFTAQSLLTQYFPPDKNYS